MAVCNVPDLRQFQSTPSAWRETADRYVSLDQFSISIHSLRMEGDAETAADLDRWEGISIHSLRMEGDSEQKTMYL